MGYGFCVCLLVLPIYIYEMLSKCTIIYIYLDMYSFVFQMNLDCLKEKGVLLLESLSNPFGVFK